MQIDRLTLGTNIDHYLDPWFWKLHILSQMSIIGWTPSQTHFQLGHRTRWFPMTQSSELVASILSGTSIIRRSYPRLTIRYLMYNQWHLMYRPLPLCTIDDSIFSSVPSVKNPSHSKVYPPVCIEHPLLYPQWLAPKLQGTTSKLPRRPVGTNPKISLPEETNLDRMGHGVSPAWHLVHCHQPWKWCLLDLTKTSFNLLPPWRSHICKYKHKLQQFVCEEWASVEFIQ